MFAKPAFVNILEKATSHLQLEPDWNAIIAVSDCIRQGDVEPKFALNSIKKKLSGPNLHVNLFALLVLESCVKNCGPSFHSEVATKSFMETLHDIVEVNANAKVKEKVLELIQTWAHAFRNQPNYRPVIDMSNRLKLEGYKFPQLKESDAMFSANVAPEWVDGDCCNRCRVAFTLLERRHHCRACGQVFCQKCSSKTSILPKFGIEKEVRVCEDCYDKLNTTQVSKPAKLESSTTKSKSVSITTSSNEKTSSSTLAGKSEDELREEEELQMAIALSKSEIEVNERQQRKYASDYGSSFGDFNGETKDRSKSQDTFNNHNRKSMEELDPNLSMYMDRSYWEQKSRENSAKRSQSEAQPSAPQQTLPRNSGSTEKSATNHNHTTTQSSTSSHNGQSTTVLLKSENNDDDIEKFQNNLRSTIEIFVNRMNSNKNRGRPISNDSAVQSMFLNVTNMHSQLLKHIQQQDDLRSKFELMQDKLSQAKDARAALNALRQEYSDKLRREAEEAEMIRQQQMALKLDIMRKQKQEYLQFQRQIALQRVQDQAREMKMRIEQQKYATWQQQQQQQQQTIQQQQQTIQQYPQPNPMMQYNQLPPSSIYPPPSNNYGAPIMNYAGDYQNMLLQNQYTNGSLPPTSPHHANAIPNRIPTQIPHNSDPVHTMPTHVAIPDPSLVYHAQGVYNMQAMNNSLPTTTPSNTSIDTNTQTQYTTQTSEPESTSTVNTSTTASKTVDEEPLISFD